MSDHQRIRGLGGIKPSRMPVSATPEITVTEAEQRLGIAPEVRSGNAEQDSARKGNDRSEGDVSTTFTPENQDNLPQSIRNKKPRLLTVSRSFRLPLPLVDELEQVARIHDIPMVTILAEALELHLARFPRSKQS